MRRKLLVVSLVAFIWASAQTRQEITLSDNWSFSHDQQTWETVCVPHDWAIAGPFDKKWDLQKVAIEQNGEKDRRLCHRTVEHQFGMLAVSWNLDYPFVITFTNPG